MPVRVELSPAQGTRKGGEAGAVPAQAPGTPQVTLGLVNNMPVAAFRATERQFMTLLNSASEGLTVRLLLYTLPGASVAERREHGGERYASVETLWDGDNVAHSQLHLDGLIVTGAEPIHPDLRDEPYWPSFTRLVDWARTDTSSTVWSCLAAHAAILHLDGIARRRRATKLSSSRTRPRPSAPAGRCTPQPPPTLPTQGRKPRTSPGLPRPRTPKRATSDSAAPAVWAMPPRSAFIPPRT